ncbi:MAG TPA: RAMP superfamily CRISPR-associated protein [Spirillospora sp.]|nr:RAMP superfamily CRISPR-associated protein [Spirillospora sp.]
MTYTISLTLRMLSDWHIGAGTGQHGRLSWQVQRDENRLPFVPAKSLNGVWRDGCEIAARALDGQDGDRRVWHDWVDYLFGYQPASPGAEADAEPVRSAGHPRPAALRYLGPLRVPGGLRPAVAQNRRLVDAATFVKPGVAHDPVTGAAREDMLRFDEMARGGMTLEGTAELPDGLSEEQFGCARALLWAGARLVEGIGAKRRRGSGRCRLDLGGEGLPPSAGDLERWTADPVPPPEPEQPPGPDSAERRAAGDGWEGAVLHMTLETPLLAHDRTVGNLVQGRDHAPGWMLLGPVLRRLDSPAAAAAARCGDLVVTPATPQVDGRPGRPVPHVFERDKDDKDVYVNRAVESVPKGRAFKRVRKGYVSGAAHVTVETPAFDLRMHNTIEDTSQRPAQSLGGVYVYEALAAGTVLAAEVRVRRGLLDAGWWEKLSGRWRLGRSRKDDYGLLSVTAEPFDIPDEPMPGEPAPVASGDRLRVWLLSDVLVRDARLAPSDDPADFSRLLQRAFAAAGADGVELEPVLQEPGRIPSRYEIARTDSWHRGWRLPRPVLLGFAAGGCLTFEVRKGSVGAGVLSAVERSGIGERRGEGFGRIRINDPLLIDRVPQKTGGDRETSDPPEAPRPVGSLLSSADPGHAGARLIETAAWRTEIWRLAEERAACPGEVLGPLIELSATRLNALRRLFDHLDEEPARLHARITALTRRWNAPQATAAIHALLIDRDVWETLGFTGQAELILTAEGLDVLRRDLRADALRSLLTACLAAHTRSEAHPEEARR